MSMSNDRRALALRADSPDAVARTRDHAGQDVAVSVGVVSNGGCRGREAVFGAVGKGEA